MKQKSIITLIVILAIAGAISYGIIWYRKKYPTVPSTTDKKTDTGSSATTVNTGTNTGAGYALPKIETYAWWINKIGHAKFPLGMSSVGVEVLKVQEVLNVKSVAKGLPKITEDGIWGFNTDTRFKLLYPNYSLVTLFQYTNDFDPDKETLS